MGHFKALSLAGALLLATAGAAYAADLLPPPPAPEPILAEPDFSGWYIRGDVGVGITNLSSLRPSFAPAAGFTPASGPPDVRVESKSLDDSAFVSAGVGYQFNNWLRADVTAEHRTAARFSAIESYNQGFYNTPPDASRAFDLYSASIGHNVVLANGYVDLGTWYGITPFVGAGAGYAMHKVSGLNDSVGGLGFAKEKTSGNLAWALMAGLGYSVNQNLKLEMGYRYLDLGSAKSAPIVCQNQPAPTCPNESHAYKIASHDFHVGMRWMFGANGAVGNQNMTWGDNGSGYPAGAPSRGPIVRRY